MADPLSITASLLAVTTAAVHSTRSLCETVKRFKDRNKTLRRLQDELEDLTAILDSLTQVTNAEDSMLTLLQGPVERCSQVCHEFEESMKVFRGKSKTSFRDWTRMEFMRGDMNDFIETIAGYKSTISVGLGTITMSAAILSLLSGSTDVCFMSHTSKISRQVVQEYNEMVQDTSYNLQLHLRRIDEKMTQLNIEKPNVSSASIDLEDEREVTKQCLRICQDASSYIVTLSDRESSLLQETPQNSVEGSLFEAQLRTRQALEGNRISFAETIEVLRKRLSHLIQDGSTEDNKEKERSRLQADVDISRQCLDVCKVASEVSRQTVYRIGEVVAEGNSDQVVVTTLADLFDVKKALSKDHSAQLVGSMTPESLRDLTEKRYGSRFGTLACSSDHVDTDTKHLEAQKINPAPAPQGGRREQSPGPRTRQFKPSPNEVRKRQADGSSD